MHFKWVVTWTHGTQPNVFYGAGVQIAFLYILNGAVRSIDTLFVYCIHKISVLPWHRECAHDRMIVSLNDRTLKLRFLRREILVPSEETPVTWRANHTFWISLHVTSHAWFKKVIYYRRGSIYFVFFFFLTAIKMGRYRIADGGPFERK